MERFSIEQRILIVKTHYKNGECYAETVRKLRAIFGRDNAPAATTVSRLVQKFEESGSVATRKSPGRNRNVRTQQNIAVVQDSVKVSPVKSLRRRSKQLGMSTSSVHRILKNEMVESINENISLELSNPGDDNEVNGGENEEDEENLNL